jgi:glycosyltransferase involved in cell wall biosynthesis
MKQKAYLSYVPHGINHTQFFPIDKLHPLWNELHEFKSKLVAEDEFVIFHNARNIRRKHTADLILAYNEFCNQLTEEQAKKCVLLFHTDPVDDNGTDLPAVIEACCPWPVKFTSSRVVTTKELNFLYNCADITINIASNEGFGLGTAESVMAGTPIVINVTGGMQDQCGFKSESGEYLTESEYNKEMYTNAVKKYTKHGSWAKPVFPKVRTLQGSPATPYIFDDIADYRDVAESIKYWYNTTKSFRRECGLQGREYFRSSQSGLSASEMGKRMIQSINMLFENWNPRTRVELFKL